MLLSLLWLLGWCGSVPRISGCTGTAKERRAGQGIHPWDPDCQHFVMGGSNQPAPF